MLHKMNHQWNLEIKYFLNPDKKRERERDEREREREREREVITS